MSHDVPPKRCNSCARCGNNLQKIRCEILREDTLFKNKKKSNLIMGFGAPILHQICLFFLHGCTCWQEHAWVCVHVCVCVCVCEALGALCFPSAVLI